MATYKARGIIIKRRNFFEADRIITILTKYRGKLSIIAKGVRKSLSKNAGAIELFVLSDMILAEGRNFDILASAQIVKSFKGLRESLEKTAIAYQISELTDKILEENQEHADTYNLFQRVLGYLSRVHLSKNNLIFEYYAVRSVSQVGFAPQLKTCVGCREKLEKENNFFSPGGGGILCAKCALSDKMIIEITSDQIKLLRLFLERDIAFLSKIKINKKDAETLSRIINYYLEYIVEKELKSGRFARTINMMGQEEKNDARFFRD